jgi:RNA polymerase sigma factor (sigma-70 family)
MAMNTPAATFFPATLERPITPLLELARRAAPPAVGVRMGSVAAVGRLLREIAPKVRVAVRAVLGAHHPDLDDTVQLALMAFVQALPAFREECDPVRYARVIAVRKAIAARKRERTLRSRHDGDAEPDALASANPSPSDTADRDQRKKLLRDLLAELPDEQSEALALRVGLGWSIEEIARETGAPVNTIRSRMRLAKERLRARIESDAAYRDLRDD